MSFHLAIAPEARFAQRKPVEYRSADGVAQWQRLSFSAILRKIYSR